MGKINSVVAGDYLKAEIWSIGKTVYLAPDSNVNHTIELNKDIVESYNVIDENQQKSATSAVGRAAIGGFLLGGVGLFAGLSAKNKRTFAVEIIFKDDKKSLALLNEKTYAALMKALF